MKRCPNCDAENSDDATFCNLCLSVLGFESPEYAIVDKGNEGFLTEYPSSFKIEAAPNKQPQTRAPSEAYHLGGWSPSEFHPHGNLRPRGLAVSSPDGALASKTISQGRYVPRISAEKVIRDCAITALIATAVSVLLEWVFSALGFGALLRGEITLSRVYYLIPLIIPAFVCGYVSGYRIERYGWLFGAVTVLIWSLVFRPLVYGVIRWMVTGGFDIMVSLSTANLVLIICLFLPTGIIAGWLGEKRATTGLGL